jgi:hypothetical protein
VLTAHIDPYNDEPGKFTNGYYEVSINGYAHYMDWEGIGEDPAKLRNDETWTMNHLTVSGDHQGADKPDILTANGGAAYVGAVREGDNENNGMRLSVDFDHYAYQFNPLPPEATNRLNIQISGKVKASCHPAWITYATVDNLIDHREKPDAEGDRMPSAGVMTLATDNRRGTQRAVFGLNPTTEKAQVTIKNDVYPSWRSIIEGSSCEVFQDIIDRINPLLP